MDPEIAQLLRELTAAGNLPLAGNDVEAAREVHREMAFKLTQPIDADESLAAVDSHDILIAGPEVDLAARVFRPGQAFDERRPADEQRPTVLYLHGGGHVLGDLDTHDWHARALSADTDSVVVSVEYRKAPEQRWPIAVMDALVGYDWIADQVADLGGDQSRIGICGDSAGGNLAAVVLSHRSKGAVPPKAALLLYPAVDFSLAREYRSRLEQGQGGYLTVGDMGWFGLMYAGKGAPVDDPDLSPLMADVSNFPPTVVVVAQFDPLRDEGRALADKIAAAGGQVTLIDADGMPHGFYDFAHRSLPARELARQCHEVFAHHLST